MEDSDEDIEGQDLSHPPRTAVLWEKSFEQSIFVDLSEDESLHFSDLESSFPVRLTQSAGSEASLQLSGKGFSSSQIFSMCISVNLSLPKSIYIQTNKHDNERGEVNKD